ncbi:MAG: ABC transporter ATP-binding protein [Thomasclavelia sp.]|nr:ABC transporter ATP-binding protein [Thomasclavelia sp.]
MWKIKKYFLKYWPMIIGCALLLLGQASSELSLPDYMSNIVSNGIQAGGFDSSVSKIYTADTYNNLKLFMNDNEVKLFESSYKEVAKGKASKDIKEEFPKANANEIYVLKDISSSKKDKLETTLIKPTLMVTSISSMKTDSKEYKKMFSKLPEGVSPFMAISMMPQNQRLKMLENVDKQMDTMGESTIKIAAGNGVKAEYKKLGADTSQVQNDYIIKNGITMLLIALGGTLCAISVAYFSSKTAAKVARDLRSAVFKKVESFSNEEFSKFSTASLITRTTNDITQVQMVVMMFLRIVIYSPILAFGALYKVIDQANQMTWIIGVVLLIIAIIMVLAFIIVIPKFTKIQTLVDKLNLRMRENLSGTLVIRAFGNEKHSEEKFDEANDNLTKVNLFVNRAMAVLMPIMMFIMNATTLVIIYYGAKQVDLGNIQIGQMMAFLQYIMQIVMSFLMIAMIAIMLPRGSVAAKRIYEVLSTEPKIIDPASPKAFDESKKGLLEFKNVSFSYPGAKEPVLENINFTAMPGKTTAFIGSTGSGKSTLINLIPRFYEATSGEIVLDGVNIKDVTQHDLREKLGIVPQKANLIGGTIKSNLMFGTNDATDEELNEVIAVSQAKEFVDSKESGLETTVAQGGSNFSGGQKQRLAIARAIARNPEVLIFDDSFSALDFKTDATLRHELKKMSQKTKNTILIVGQRIASIMDADQIIVLNEGKIVGKGTHDELMNKCEIYKEIALSQLSKEELANG